jgi:hypothetical protein
MVGLPAMKLINAHPLDIQCHPGECRKRLKDDGRGWDMGLAFIVPTWEG